jgi:hypothetical protein
MEWYKKSNEIEYGIALILFTICFGLTVFNIFSDFMQGIFASFLALFIGITAKIRDRLETIENKLKIK